LAILLFHAPKINPAEKRLPCLEEAFSYW
jgi:hypothetical protein